MSAAPKTGAATGKKSASAPSQVEPPPWESPQWQKAVSQNPGLAPFFDNLESFVELPEGIKKLRQLIMELGVAGKLLDQNVNDEPVSTLLDRIADRRKTLIESKVIRAKTTIRDKKLPESALPKGWVWAKFGEITFNRDGDRVPVRKADRETQAKTYDYYGASGVIDKVADYIFDQPLLLIGEDGANLINRSTPIAFIAEGKYWVNNHAHAVDLISRDMMDYVALFINSISLESYITGMAQPKMNQARMNSIPVAIPPEAEQRRIVSKVAGLMSLCDTLESHRRARISVRERASRSVLASLTSAPRSVSPSSGEPQVASRGYQVSGEETLKSAWHRLSDHFEVLLDQPSSVDSLRQSILQLAVQGKLVPQTDEDLELLSRETVVGDYLTMQNGYAFKSQWFQKDGIRLVRNANIGHGSLNWSDAARISEERAKEYERFRIAEGDIVLTLDRPLISTGLKVALITKADLPSLLLQRVARPVFKENANVRPDYFYTWMQSPFFMDSIDPGKSNGVPHISTREVQKIEFAPPTEASQKRIVSKVSVLLSQCDELSTEMRSRQSTTDALLTALIHQILENTDGAKRQ